VTLTAPELDDRTFQGLVDEAKRRLEGRCPEWTDHNVSDPGMMLVELVAAMVDQLLFRLNQVPDRLYVKFLDLIGVQPFAARPASVDVTFWLSAPQPRTLRIDRGTQVATRRTATELAIVFSVVEPRDIPPCAFSRVATVAASGGPEDRTASASAGDFFSCFGEPPAPGDAFEVELTEHVAGCVVRLELTCDPAFGKDVDPERPPLAWDAFVDGSWRACESRDGTQALNRTGSVVVHVPAAAGGGGEPTRLRCRVTDAGDRPRYDRSPRLGGFAAATIGGTARTAQGDLHEGEELGSSDGHPSQRFALGTRPAVEPEEGLVVESRIRGEVQLWDRVPDFARSDAADRHFTFDERAGEIAFGPAVRQARPEETRQYGAIPPAGARLSVRRYVAGGGEIGNVGTGAITVLKTSVPFVARVENRAGATGGRREETLEEVKLRGPVELRSLSRAVTAEDYEHFAAAAAPGVARVRCTPAQAGGVARLVLIPRFDDTPTAPVPVEALRPSDRVVEAVKREIEKRRVIGARFSIGPAHFRAVRVDAVVRLRPGWDKAETERRAIAALHAYFNPVTGGSDGSGWPFGGDVFKGTAYVVLQDVAGVEIIQRLSVYEVDVATGRPLTDDDLPRLYLDPDTVILSRGHKVAALSEDVGDD
jgi:predicted phage baseplate assembly protein